MEDPTYYEKQRGYDKKRKKIMRENFTDEERFDKCVRVMIKNSLEGYEKGSRTHEILGIDYEGFRKHIESQFEEGMHFGNHNHKGWHIEHIIPKSTAKTYEEKIKVNHYTNLRPMWSGENWSKGKKVLEEEVKSFYEKMQ